MSNVLLVGAFGQGNPGDEALCAAFCAALRAHDLTIVSSDPVTAGATHGVPAISSAASIVGPAVRRADAVVVAGGTIFKQLDRASGRRPNSLLVNTAALVAGARASGTSVAMIGVGAGALRGRVARSLARWIVPRTSLIVLRDEESASVLADAGVPAPFWIGADPAWQLFGSRLGSDRGITRRGAADRGTITVALSHHAVSRATVDALVDALDPLSADWRIRLQPWQTGANNLDLQLAAALADRLHSAEIIDAPRDLVHAAEIFAGDDLVIGMRFHALVAAAVAGSRFVAIAHEPKLAGLSRRLEQASVPAHASPEVLRGTFEWGLANEPATATAVQGEMAAASHAFELLDLLLGDASIERPNELAALPLSSGRGAW